MVARLVLPLALLATACGPRFAPDELVAADATPAVVALAPSEQPSQEPSALGQGPASAPATESGAPQATPPVGRSPDYGSQHNNGAVRIELSATCVRPGDVLVITLRTPPRAGLGMVIGYSDNQPHGAMLTGESDAEGVYVWRVAVEPTVPDGPATVLVTSTGPNWEQEGGGTADRKFTVSPSGC